MQIPIVEAETLDWAAGAFGSGAIVQNVRRLAGSTSSTLYALDIVQHGVTHPCVLRFYDHTGYLSSEPDAPQHEAASLQTARHAGLHAPEMIAFDPEGTRSGGVPKLLMTRLPGAVVLAPDRLGDWLHALADALLPVHAVSADHLPWRFHPYADVTVVSPPSWSRVPHLWKQAIAVAQGPPPPMPECFIHRDYHPNNVLWQNGRISGIVDWPGGCRGTANADIAWCRENLKYLYGVPAADTFLHAYEALAGAAFTYHPYWDLLALMECLPGPPGLYPPWAEFGIRHLTPELLRERADDYLESVLRRL